MAKRKTTELTTITASALAAGDWFPVVDVSDTTDSSTGTNKKIAKSELAEATGLTAHLSDAVDAHDASAISFSPVGTIAGADVQTAVAEVATDAASALSTHAAVTSSVHGISTFGATLVDDADATAARSTLGLGSIATQASNSVTITGGSVTGITDLAIADGGTGASSASAALTALGGAPIYRRMKPGQYYGASWDGADTAAALSTLGAIYTVPFIVGEASQLFDRIGIEVTVAASAGGVVRLGVYADDGDGYPGTLQFETAALASTATGAVTETITQTLSGGLYWVAVVAQVATCTVRAKSGSSWLVGENSLGNANVYGYLQTGVTSGALPSTFTASVFAHQLGVKPMLRAAANP